MNGAYEDDSSDIGKLMHDFRCKNPEYMNFKQLADRTSYFKRTKKGDIIMATAYLSSNGEYTSFTVGERVITFLTSKNLEKYCHIVEWDNGYIVVQCKNIGETELEEDYIDLNPILENLYIDPNDFLHNIKDVEIQYV